MRGRTADGPSIRSARQSFGWTQEDLAVLSGMSVRTIRASEHGDRLDLATLNQIASTLGMTSSSVTLNLHEEDDSAGANRQLVSRWQQAYFDSDVDQLLAFYHRDITCEIPGTDDLPAGGGCDGIPQMRMKLMEYFRHFQWHRLFQERTEAFDNLVFHHATVEGRLLKTRQSFTASYVHEFEFRDRLIWRQVTLLDSTPIRECLFMYCPSLNIDPV